MKQLTEENRQRIKEYFTKKYNLKEGLIDYIFGKVLVSRLKDDKNFVEFAKELDRKLAASKEAMQWYANSGAPVPDSIVKAAKTGRF